VLEIGDIARGDPRVRGGVLARRLRSDVWNSSQQVSLHSVPEEVDQVEDHELDPELGIEPDLLAVKSAGNETAN
jgi:hypothetical protein